MLCINKRLYWSTGTCRQARIPWPHRRNRADWSCRTYRRHWSHRGSRCNRPGWPYRSDRPHRSYGAHRHGRPHWPNRAHRRDRTSGTRLTAGAPRADRGNRPDRSDWPCWRRRACGGHWSHGRNRSSRTHRPCRGTGSHWPDWSGRIFRRTRGSRPHRANWALGGCPGQCICVLPQRRILPAAEFADSAGAVGSGYHRQHHLVRPGAHRAGARLLPDLLQGIRAVLHAELYAGHTQL